MTIASDTNEAPETDARAEDGAGQSKEKMRKKDRFVVVDEDYLNGVAVSRAKSSNGDLYLGSDIYEPESGASPLASGESDAEFNRSVRNMDRIVAEMGKLGHGDITLEDDKVIDDLFKVIHRR